MIHQLANLCHLETFDHRGFPVVSTKTFTNFNGLFHSFDHELNDLNPDLIQLNKLNGLPLTHVSSLRVHIDRLTYLFQRLEILRQLLSLWSLRIMELWILDLNIGVYSIWIQLIQLNQFGLGLLKVICNFQFLQRFVRV